MKKPHSMIPYSAVKMLMKTESWIHEPDRSGFCGTNPADGVHIYCRETILESPWRRICEAIGKPAVAGIHWILKKLKK